MKEIKLVFWQSIVDTFQLFLQNGIENPLGNMTGNSISEEIQSNVFSCESSVFVKFLLAMTSWMSYSLDLFYLP